MFYMVSKLKHVKGTFLGNRLYPKLKRIWAGYFGLLPVFGIYLVKTVGAFFLQTNKTLFTEGFGENSGLLSKIHL